MFELYMQCGNSSSHYFKHTQKWFAYLQRGLMMMPSGGDTTTFPYVAQVEGVL